VGTRRWGAAGHGEQYANSIPADGRGVRFFGETRLVPLTRYARIEESPYLRRALALADPERAALSVDSRTYHLLHYGDPVAEYWSLVDGVTLWDVASQRQVEVAGPDAVAFMQLLVTRDLSSHEIGQCKYGFMTDPDGGIIGDPVVLRLAEDRFWLSAADADIHLWCQALAHANGYAVDVTVPDVAPVQIQGPHAPAVMDDIFGDDLPDLGYYRLVRRRHAGLELVISRTGWGGTDGYEVYVVDARADDNARAERWWDIVMRAGERHDIVAAAPNHVRRIESGMLALGCDIDEHTNPLEVGSGFDWMVDLDQPDDFVGKAALERIRSSGPTRRIVGVDLDGPDLGTFTDGDMPRVLPVRRDGIEVGTLTSACRSPRLRRNIGYAKVGIDHASLGTRLTVSHPIHGRLDAVVVEKPHLK
jgi:glycine cleavage system aminomethyltransferase T